MESKKLALRAKWKKAVLMASGRSHLSIQPELESHRYEIIPKVLISKNPTYQVYTYKLSQEEKIKIRERRPGVYTAEDFSSDTDITGNATLWNAEECLAYYLHKTLAECQGDVLELGAGIGGLAGCTLAKKFPEARVVLSEISPVCIENLEYNVNLNGLANTTVERLPWGEDLARKFELILAADCLYFLDAQPLLINTIRQSLAPGGKALIIGPRRKGSLDAFTKLCQEAGLDVRISEDYDNQIMDIHQSKLSDSSYNPDEYFPVLIELSDP